MTYWIIARFKESGVDNVYLAADIRVSRPAYSNLTENNPLREFADTSEKLFVREYFSTGNEIKIGLCTSGFAGLSDEFTITNIVNNFFQSISSSHTNIHTASALIEHLKQFITNSDFKTIFNFSDAFVVNFLQSEAMRNGKTYSNLSDYVLKETCFGVGLVFNNTTQYWASISSWNGSVIQNHNDTGYLEASFATPSIDELYPQAYRTERFLINIRQVLDAEQIMSGFSGQEFVERIIWMAAKTNALGDNMAQSISETCDFARLSPAHPIRSRIEPKENVNQSSYDTLGHPLSESAIPRDEMSLLGGQIALRRNLDDARARMDRGGPVPPPRTPSPPYYT